MERYSYIYYVKCPIDDSIKFLSLGIRPNTPSIIRQSFLYREWRRQLKKENCIPIFCIIDNVNQDEEGFWLEHYQDLFRTWNISLWTDQLNENIKEAARFNAFEVERYLNANSNRTELKRIVLNLETIVHLIKHLMNNSFRSCEIDEFSLTIIFTYFYGFSLTDISKFTEEDIWKFLKSCKRAHYLYRFENLEEFIHNATVVIGAKQPSDQSSCMKFFKNIRSSRIFNQEMKDILEYFGFNQTFKYQDRIAIRQLLLFRTNASSDLDRTVLEDSFGMGEKEILYDLINSTKSRYIILSEKSSLYKEVLSSPTY